MAKKTKIPKKIAGVKVPKTLRRGLKDLAASQTGRVALVEALAAAGAALTVPKATGAKAREVAADARAATVSALEDGARAFTEALHRRELAKAPPQATTPTSASTH